MNTPSQFLHVPGLLDAATLEYVRNAINAMPFSDGRATAGDAALLVKHNLQAAESPQKQQLDQLLLQRIVSPPVLHMAMFPARFYPLIYSKYQPGMEYGWHLDSPVMGNPPVRTDLAMTLFLNEPDSYDGGELEVQVPGELSRWKLPAGDAIFYPAGFLHRVAPVTRGERLAVITWMQSAVRDAQHRQVLWDLKSGHDAITAAHGHSEDTAKILHTFSRLMRLWVEL
jgi:PKHD-type hydroxylase